MHNLTTDNNLAQAASDAPHQCAKQGIRMRQKIVYSNIMPVHRCSGVFQKGQKQQIAQKPPPAAAISAQLPIVSMEVHDAQCSNLV